MTDESDRREAGTEFAPLNPERRQEADAVRVLVVCTANQCRSPMAEFLLRQAVEERGLNWQVSSAGTHAVGGQPMHPNTLRLLRSRGITTGSWTTRRIDHAVLDGADLVLTATRQHRSLIVGARPDLLDHTFPLLQFSSLAAAARGLGMWSPRSGAVALLETMRTVQASTQLPAEVDLRDPVGQLYRRFRACGRTIDRAVAQIFGD